MRPEFIAARKARKPNVMTDPGDQHTIGSLENNHAGNKSCCLCLRQQCNIYKTPSFMCMCESLHKALQEVKAKGLYEPWKLELFKNDY